jgi:hypothetical protein
LGQQETLAPQHTVPLFDHFVGAAEQRDAGDRADLIAYLQKATK